MKANVTNDKETEKTLSYLTLMSVLKELFNNKINVENKEKFKKMIKNLVADISLVFFIQIPSISW